MAPQVSAVCTKQIGWSATLFTSMLLFFWRHLTMNPDCYCTGMYLLRPFSATKFKWCKFVSVHYGHKYLFELSTWPCSAFFMIFCSLSVLGTAWSPKSWNRCWRPITFYHFCPQCKSCVIRFDDSRIDLYSVAGWSEVYDPLSQRDRSKWDLVFLFLYFSN